MSHPRGISNSWRYTWLSDIDRWNCSRFLAQYFWPESLFSHRVWEDTQHFLTMAKINEQSIESSPRVFCVCPRSAQFSLDYPPLRVAHRLRLSMTNPVTSFPSPLSLSFPSLSLFLSFPEEGVRRDQVQCHTRVLLSKNLPEGGGGRGGVRLRVNQNIFFWGMPGLVWGVYGNSMHPAEDFFPLLRPASTARRGVSLLINHNEVTADSAPSSAPPPLETAWFSVNPCQIMDTIFASEFGTKTAKRAIS
jgi:hypothetical protein